MQVFLLKVFNIEQSQKTKKIQQRSVPYFGADCQPS